MAVEPNQVLDAAVGQTVSPFSEHTGVKPMVTNAAGENSITGTDIARTAIKVYNTGDATTKTAALFCGVGLLAASVERSPSLAAGGGSLYCHAACTAAGGGSCSLYCHAACA